MIRRARPRPATDPSFKGGVGSPGPERRAIGLKVFMALAAVGERVYIELIEHQSRIGDRVRTMLGEAGREVMSDSLLPVVCFTHPDLRADQRSAGDILQEMYRRNRVWVSKAHLGSDAAALRACVTSCQTNEADLDCLVEERNRP